MSTNALDYVTIEGFKSIGSIEKLELRPINIVIGANGSGKSNFVGAFAFLHAIREGKLRDYVTVAGGAERVLHFGSKTTKQLRLHLSFQNEVNQYELTLTPTDDDGLYPSREVVSYWDKARYPNKPYAEGLLAREQRREAGISGPGLEKIPRYVKDRLGSWRIYHLHDTSSSSLMRKTASVGDDEYLKADGSNLAAFLYFLRTTHESCYELIRRTVQQVAPFFDDFRMRPRERAKTINLEWRHKRSDQFFDASSFSDGTLRFIALATLLLQPEQFRPSLILVDEPELGLHPYAIGMLASLIRQASVKTQVIVSTQSSLLLDHFEPADVLVANRVDDATRIVRLAPREWEKWLEDYSLGQLWEKNEFGGRPVPA